MRDQQQTRDLVEQAVELAQRAGADSADAVFAASRSSAVQVRMGSLEDVHRSEAEAIGIRVFAGQRSATVSTSDFDSESLSELVGRAIEMARQAPEDPYAGLAPSELLAKPPFAEFDDWDPVEPEPKALQQLVLEAEGAALGVKGVTNSNGSGTSSGASIRGIATSGGFSGISRSTTHSLSASVVAGEGAGMQRDYDWHSARHAADLEDAATIGTRAGERAVARLNPIKLKPGPMAVLYEPRVSTGLLGHFAQAIAGSAIARKSSFLQDKLGEQIFARGVNIMDDPFRPRGLRSRAFDAEGVTVRRLALIKDGVLTSWVAEAASARQLGILPTGHAVRGISGAPGSGPSNFYLEAGERSAEAIIASYPRLLVLTELIGQGVNPVTGDYSRGASGFLYENGEKVGAVSEITVASNLVEMFTNLEPASDLEFRQGIDAPSILVPEMMVGSA